MKKMVGEAVIRASPTKDPADATNRKYADLGREGYGVNPAGRSRSFLSGCGRDRVSFYDRPHDSVASHMLVCRFNKKT